MTNISHLKGEEENSVRFVKGMAKNKSALKNSFSEKHSCPLGVHTDKLCTEYGAKSNEFLLEKAKSTFHVKIYPVFLQMATLLTKQLISVCDAINTKKP